MRLCRRRNPGRKKEPRLIVNKNQWYDEITYYPDNVWYFTIRFNAV